MRISVFCSAMLAYVVIGHPPPAMAQDRGLAIEYTVKVADIPGQLFHVTTDIRNINQPSLDLSLPVWSPGWYVIENYAKNISRFRVSEPGGRELRPALVRKQTWRIDTKGISRITVEFDYRASRALRESGAHRAGLRVLHWHATFPAPRGSSFAAERGAV